MSRPTSFTLTAEPLMPRVTKQRIWSLHVCPRCDHTRIYPPGYSRVPKCWHGDWKNGKAVDMEVVRAIEILNKPEAA